MRKCSRYSLVLWHQGYALADKPWQVIHPLGNYFSWEANEKTLRPKGWIVEIPKRKAETVGVSLTCAMGEENVSRKWQALVKPSHELRDDSHAPLRVCRSPSA